MLAGLVLTPAARRRAVWAMLVALFVAFEIYVLFVKRSGETAYLPPASSQSASLEVAGEVTLVQSFVMGADGLDGITVFPQATPAARGVVQMNLQQVGLDRPIAVEKFPARVLSVGAFTWHVPRVDRSAGNVYSLQISLPEAPAGQGARFVIGEPRYLGGDLAIGGRTQWGDLTFTTHASRARTIDALRHRRRSFPPALQSEAGLVGLLLLFNWAVATVLWHVGFPSLQQLGEPAFVTSENDQAGQRRRD